MPYAMTSIRRADSPFVPQILYRYDQNDAPHIAVPFLLQNMNQWIILKQKGISLVPYFKEHKYNRIAIYGMSYLGERLLDDLKETEIEVVYGIDRNADSLYSDVDIISPDDDFMPVDAIVVTATFYFDEICDNLQSKVSCPIISLEDVLYDY